MARVANPYSKMKTQITRTRIILSSDLEKAEKNQQLRELDTLVPGAVQHVCRTGYPSNKGIRKSLDINEKPNRQKNQKLIKKNPKPKAQLLAEPVTHRLYFKAARVGV